MDNKTKRQIEQLLLEGSMTIVCKAKDLSKNLTLASYGIGNEWLLDEEDEELICLN